jgi:hypothetical protein
MKLMTRWDLQSPKLFAYLVHCFIQGDPLPEGIVSVRDHFFGKMEDSKKTK